MATIVYHKPTDKKYVLVGAGFGQAKAATPGTFWGNLAPVESSESFPMLAVSGTDGSVGWVRSDDVTVVSVDGKSPHDLLLPSGPYR